MNEAHRTQVGHIKDGACFAVSLDGLQNDWLNTRGRGHGDITDEHIRRRNEELRSWVCSGQVTHADEGPLAPRSPPRRPLVCWSQSGLWRLPNWPLPSPSSLTAMPRQLRPPEPSKSICHLRNAPGTGLGRGLGLEWESEAAWTRLSATEEQLYCWIVQNKKESMVTLPTLLYVDDGMALPQNLDNTYYLLGAEESTNGNVGYNASHTGEDLCGLENLNSKWRRVLSVDSADEGPCEDNFTGNRNTGTSHALEDADGDQRAARHVTFCDEVIVYLFDQETPTSPQPSLSAASFEEDPSTPGSYLNTNEDLALDHSFEWEDEFSALDWAGPARTHCHQERRRSDPGPRRPRSPSDQGRYHLPKTSLVLTHVPESDLDDRVL